MRPTVRAVFAAIAIAYALSPAAAAEEKSTKPRIAVIEFANKSEAQLEVDSAQWGEWIADVERPQAAGSWAKADGLDVGWDVPEAAAKLPGKRTPPTVTLKRGTNSGATAGRGIDIARVDGEIVAPSGSAVKQPKTRTMMLAPGATRPQSGQATGKRQHMPIRTRAYYDAPLDRGSVMLRLAQPWAGCAVGDRFNGVYLTTGVSHRYRLDGAEIASCENSTVTINYTRFAPAGEPVR